MFQHRYLIDETWIPQVQGMMFGKRQKLYVIHDVDYSSITIKYQ